MLVRILHAGNYAVNGLINVKRFNAGDVAELGNDDYAIGIVQAKLAEWYHEPAPQDETEIELPKPATRRGRKK